MKRFSGLELRSLSINTFAQFAVRIFSSFATLTVTLLIAYFMGLSSVGSFTKVVTFVSLFYLFLDFGFNSIILRDHFKTAEKSVGNLVSLRLVIAFFLIPTISLLALLLPYNETAGTGFSQIEKYGILVFSLVLISIAILNSFQLFLQKKLIFQKGLLPGFVSSIIIVLVVLYGVYSGNFFLLFASYVFAGLIQVSILFAILRSQYGMKLYVNKIIPFAKTLFLNSWPLGVMLIFNLLYTKIDVILLSFYKTSEAVGVYGLSYRFFEVAIALPTFLAASTYPILLKKVNDKKDYRKLFKRYLKLYTVLSFVALFFAFFGAPLIGLLRNGFYLSIVPLQILSLSLPFFFLTSILQWHFLIKNKLKFLLPLYGGALILNIVLNMIFIPAFSYYASAVITVLCEGLVFAVMLWYFIRSSRKPERSRGMN